MDFKMTRLLTIVFLLSALSNLCAQTSTYGVVTGLVTDALSGEALAYTNVFLANTTIGDAADDNGEFVLDRIPPGSYQLVISRIGYEMQVRDIRVSPNQRQKLAIKLDVKSIEGEEVRVEAEKSNRQWRRQLREFEREFIGSMPNAKKCKIVNPQVISFRREKFDLIAESENAIIVENRALGYQLDIILASYRWGLGSGQFVIYPKYSLMQPQNERQQKAWQKKRRETFHTSLRDFFATLYTGDVFPRYTVLKIKEETPGKFKSLAMDSLAIEKGSSNTLKRLVNSSMLRVEHWTGGISTIDLKYGYIDFDERGNIFPPDGVRVSGYWGQFRVADSLPFDYFPQEEK
jgi:hypothetical protein